MIAIWSVLFAAFQAPAFAEGTPLPGFRDHRYCEVLLGTGGMIFPDELDVYNTIGLNDCPQDQWGKLSEAQIKTETGAKFVILNGPRFWVIDRFVGSSPISTTVKSFGEIEMRKAGVLQVSLGDFIGSRKPYRPRQIHRKTVVLFKAGFPVFQLIDNKGAIYFMQSYSLEKAELSYDKLASLGEKLDLPRGWRFRSVVLNQDYFLKAENEWATVLQDDLRNTYQKSPEVAD